MPAPSFVVTVGIPPGGPPEPSVSIGARPRLGGAQGLVGLVQERRALERQATLAWVILAGAVGVEPERPLAVAALELRLVHVHAPGEPEHVEERGARCHRLHLPAGGAGVRRANLRLAAPATHRPTP